MHPANDSRVARCGSALDGRPLANLKKNYCLFARQAHLDAGTFIFECGKLEWERWTHEYVYIIQISASPKLDIWEIPAVIGKKTNSSANMSFINTDHCQQQYTVCSVSWFGIASKSLADIREHTNWFPCELRAATAAASHQLNRIWILSSSSESSLVWWKQLYTLQVDR